MHAILQLDRDALAHNLSRVKALAPSSRVMAVIKANAYGHGMVEVAHALMDADAFAVANLEEGVRLREAGIEKELVILQGVLNQAELEKASSHRLGLVVHQSMQIELLRQASLNQPVSVWIKMDTGMHRLGLTAEQFPAAIEALSVCAAVQQPLRLMSHFANADDPVHPSTDLQLKDFQVLTQGFDLECSIANSAGLCHWEASHLDWVRPGIMLYGVNPFNSGVAADLDLKPAMRLSSRLIAINQHHEGDAVGYGGTWVCPEDMSVGVVAVGYGDGYPRHAPSGTPVLIHEQRVPLVGRVSMDMICVDLRKIKNVSVGDEVVLWGDGLPVEDIARKAGTIGYELCCKITSRVVRTLK
jgi:alanine racemase